MADVSTSPSTSPEGQRPTASPAGFLAQRDYDLSTNASLHEIILSQGRLLERTETLVRDVGAISTKVDDVKGTLTFLKGAAWAIGALVPVAAAVIWWSLSDRIDRLHQLLDNRPAQSQQVTPPPPIKRGP